MQDVINSMVKSLRVIGGKAFTDYAKMGKEEWVTCYPSQVVLLVNLVSWVTDVGNYLLKVASDPEAMKKAHVHQIDVLTNNIMIVQKNISSATRQKVMCLITMDAHSRDIIEILYKE